MDKHFADSKIKPRMQICCVEKSKTDFLFDLGADKDNCIRQCCLNSSTPGHNETECNCSLGKSDTPDKNTRNTSLTTVRVKIHYAAGALCFKDTSQIINSSKIDQQNQTFSSGPIYLQTLSLLI
ncbi:hypothetical protein QUF70_06230 [Desulfobacterales bacterium HSG17]|nr:hypothetical protein [Desulfobacterales bacterium HSG17]